MTSAPQSLLGPIDIKAARKLDQLDIWPTGLYRRVLDMTAQDGVATADMADDFHDFHVKLEHDGLHIHQISVEMRRLPWSVCAGAAGELKKLTGMPILDAANWLDAEGRRQHCNHLLDLAQLAAGAAVRQVGSGEIDHRSYQIDVGCDQNEVRDARLKRDGVTKLFVQLGSDGRSFDIIESEGPMRMLRLSQLPKDVISSLTADEKEAYFVLRRAAHVSIGRWFRYDPTLTPLQMGLGPTCFTFQPDRAGIARFDPASVQDFTHHAETLLSRVKSIT